MTKTLTLLKSILNAHEESQRQTGRTTNIINQALKDGAIVVCHNQVFANMLSKEYGVKTVNFDTYSSNEYNRGIKPRKHIFDHVIEYMLIMKKLDEVEKML